MAAAAPAPLQAVSVVPQFVQQNAYNLYNSAHQLRLKAWSALTPPRAARVFFAIVYGTAAGILGLTNTLGLLSYLVAMALVRPPAARADWPPPPRRPSPRHSQTSAGIFVKLRGNTSPFFATRCAP